MSILLTGDQWEQHKLGEVVSVFDGTHQTPNYKTKGIMFLSVENINTLLSNKYISENEYRQRFKIKPQYLDVFMTRIGTIGKTNVITTHKPIAYYVSLALLRPQNIQSFFLSFIIQTSKVQQDIWKRTLQIAFPQKINKDEIGKVTLALPLQKEQIDIEKLLLKLDKLITLQQRKLKQLERLKTAMLQQLLANQRFPKVRFNDFKDSWKDYRLGEVFDEFSVKSKRENEYKLLSSTTSGMESRSGRVSGHSNIGYKVIDNGDIVLSPQNLWLGNINLNNMGKGIVSPSYHTFKIVNANPIFVNFQLKTEKMLFEYKMVSVQGASVVRRNLDMDTFKKIVIKIPNEKEQIKIASLFSSISNIINNHQNKLTQLSTLKKYLLQKMFI
ncbi:restriction endonuclease subunit S [Limosilactobacillus reuteri]|uniref:restriction endonuclease subunit S n=1 Tax=Limosilactobacillus reuteri TaxID=1598 RepID=UPI002D1FAD83|nr:restriction endonuclease subunit S [Limosilactobacillus reuteri]